MNATRKAYTEQYRKRRMMTFGGRYFRMFQGLSNDDKRIARAACASFSAFRHVEVSYNPHVLLERKRENEACQKRIEAQELLHEAQSDLEAAIDKIKRAVRGTSEENRAHAYIIPHLQSWVAEDQSGSIENIIEAIVYPEEETA